MTFFMTLVLFSAQQVSTQKLSPFWHSVNDFQLLLRLFLKFIRYSHEVFVAVVFPTFSSYLSSIFFQLNFSEFFLSCLFSIHCLVAQCVTQFQDFQAGSILAVLLCSASRFLSK